jgi:hypothetical protein
MATHMEQHRTIHKSKITAMEKVYRKEQQTIAHLTNNQNTNKLTITQIILE